jgi:hypothetical protein
MAYLDKARTRRITANADHTALTKDDSAGEFAILFAATPTDCMNVFMPSIAWLKEGGSSAKDTSEKAKRRKSISENTDTQFDFATCPPFFPVKSGD